MWGETDEIGLSGPFFSVAHKAQFLEYYATVGFLLFLKVRYSFLKKPLAQGLELLTQDRGAAVLLCFEDSKLCFRPGLNDCE